MSDEADNVFERFRAAFGGEGRRRGPARAKPATGEGEESMPYGRGRDPRPLGDVMGTFATEYDWHSPLAQAELLVQWPDLCGADTAQHATPVGIEENVLLVRCDSTAWAVNLRMMQRTLVTEIQRRFPSAGVEAVKFLGPDAPSWKHGPRAIPGRGPRDTYG